jgi:hypothetical protein
MHGRGKKRVQGFMERHDGKTSLGNPRHRYEDVIKMGLKEIGWSC